MEDENLSLATTVMSQFIGTRDAKGYTKDMLMSAYGFDEEMSNSLAQAAWKEWVEAYTD